MANYYLHSILPLPTKGAVYLLVEGLLGFLIASVCNMSHLRTDMVEGLFLSKGQFA